MIYQIFAQAKPKNCPPESTDADCLSVLPQVAGSADQVRNGLTVVFAVLAAVAVLVIIIGAISFVSAQGNPEGISKAKKTIIYALIGLIIAISAEAAVLTLLGRL